MTDYYGYNELKQKGLTSLSGASNYKFKIQHAILDGVGHVDAQVWQSQAGRAAVYQRKLPAGDDDPVRPCTTDAECQACKSA